jgi:Spy/CpxP family protein refolding chaperone
MKNKILVLLLAASIAGNVAFVVTTLVARHERATLPMDRLGLDSDQRSKLMVLREQFVAERGRAHGRMLELRRALADEVAKPAPDRARMDQILSDIAGIQAEMRPKFVAHLLDMHGVLRPEQRVGLGEILRAGGPGMMPGCPGAALEPPAGAEP